MFANFFINDIMFWKFKFISYPFNFNQKKLLMKNPTKHLLMV